jgi:hypothetical protein
MEYIYLKAEVLSRQGDSLIIRLDDGFGSLRTVAHKDSCLPEEAATKVIE